MRGRQNVVQPEVGVDGRCTTSQGDESTSSKTAQGVTHLGQLSRVSALQGVSYRERTGGGFVYSPCIYGKDEVDIPGVYEQRSKRDVFEVQSTVNQLQPSCAGVNIRVVFDTIKGLNASRESDIRIETD